MCAALKIASNVRGQLQLMQNKDPRFDAAAVAAFTQLAIARQIGHNPNENSSHSLKMPTTKTSSESDLLRPARDDSTTREVPRFDSRKLFGQGKSVHIEHDGKVYELRVTRLGKLILTA